MTKYCECGEPFHAKGLCIKHYQAALYRKAHPTPRKAMTAEERKAAQLANVRKWMEMEANREKQRAAVKRYSKTPRAREKHRQQMRIYVAKNREQERLRTAQWRKDNPEKEISVRRACYVKNREKRIAASKAWILSNPEAHAAYSVESKARRRAGGGRLPKGYKKVLFAKQDGLCAACHCDLNSSGQQIDHIIAIARGGRHCVENVQLLCPLCNRRKNARDFSAFLKILEAENNAGYHTNHIEPVRPISGDDGADRRLQSVD
jgi:5-methylcytosine-specific restriction endonuclease McrA